MQNTEKQNYFKTICKKKSHLRRCGEVILWRTVQGKSEFGLRIVSIKGI